MHGHGDRYDQGERSQQQSGDGHSNRSQQNSSKDAPGHSGHSKGDVYVNDGLEEDLEFDLRERIQEAVADD